MDFTVRSAEIAREFLDRRGVPADGRELVANAIALHHTPGVSLEIACDTTLTHVRTIMPNGETADIIADRIRVRGFVRQWRDVPSFYQGEIKIEEDIRYVRPRLGTSVLNKQCSAEIVLERR